MNFHPSKCYVLRICKIKNPTIHHHTQLDLTLKVVDHQPYLGITLSGTLNQKAHVLGVENKANRTLGCIKSHLHLCPERVKVQAYTSLVGPGLRIRQFCMGSLQDVPKALAGTSTATCCTFCYENIFKTEGCVTQALNYPNWPTLEHRRKVNRLTLMHKTLHGQAAINIPAYVKHQTIRKRGTLIQ